MKQLLLLILISVSAYSFAQSKFEYNPNRHFEAKYVLKKSTDTIHTRIINIGSFKASVYSIHTWVKRMWFIDEKGKKKMTKEDELDYLEIKDNEGDVHKMYSSLKFFDKDLGLVLLQYDGNKTKLISDFFPVSIYGNLGRSDYIIENGTEPILVGKIGWKKKLKEKFANYPDLQEEINSVDIVKVLEKYDKK
ncbi:hypothetical protein [Bergeyella porcorum]